MSPHVRGHRTISPRVHPTSSHTLRVHVEWTAGPSPRASATNVTTSHAYPRKAGPSPCTPAADGATPPCPHTSAATGLSSRTSTDGGAISPRVRGQPYHIVHASAASGAISPHTRGRRGHRPSPPHVRGNGTIFPCVCGRRGSLSATRVSAVNVTHPPCVHSKQDHLPARPWPVGPSPRASAASWPISPSVHGQKRHRPRHENVISPCFQFVSDRWTRPARQIEHHCLLFSRQTNARANHTGRAAAAHAPAPNKNARNDPKRLLDLWLQLRLA